MMIDNCTYRCTREDQCGKFTPNNSITVTGYKLWRNAHKYAVNKFGNGRLVKIEVLDGDKVIDTFMTTTIVDP